MAHASGLVLFQSLQVFNAMTRGRTLTHVCRQLIAQLGFWTFLGASYALSAGSSSISQGHDAHWSRVFGWNLTEAYLWMLLVPLVAWLGRRTAGESIRRVIFFHVGASVAVAAVETLARLTMFWLLWGPGQLPVDSLPAYLRMEFAYSIHSALLTYWMILLFTRSMDARRKLRQETLRIERLETQLAQTRLSALRMQLKPHFLFNTLNSISALVLVDPQKARVMIVRLSEFLRMTIDERHGQLVPLATELKFLECYLHIQTVRFQDRLSTSTRVDDTAAAAEVPHLILQPLVENALKHGLLCSPEPGRLTISVERCGEQLVLEVSDDGAGLAVGYCEGVGVRNTRERLSVMFGEAASFELTSAQGRGTVATVRLPYRESAHA
ncbi:MAG: histidine kinase [Dokdonella sp.]